MELHDLLMGRANQPKRMPLVDRIIQRRYIPTGVTEQQRKTSQAVI